jgi:hypothetical protein
MTMFPQGWHFDSCLPKNFASRAWNLMSFSPISLTRCRAPQGRKPCGSLWTTHVLHSCYHVIYLWHLTCEMQVNAPVNAGWLSFIFMSMLFTLSCNFSKIFVIWGSIEIWRKSVSMSVGGRTLGTGVTLS